MIHSSRTLKAFVAAAWLLAMMCGVLVIGSSAGGGKGDLVFCPLQNKWVPRESPQTNLDLGRICAPRELLERFARRAALRSGTIDEAAFFDFAAKGDAALSQVPSRPNRSPQLLTSPIGYGAAPTHQQLDPFVKSHGPHFKGAHPPVRCPYSGASLPDVITYHETVYFTTASRAPPTLTL